MENTAAAQAAPVGDSDIIDRISAGFAAAENPIDNVVEPEKVEAAEPEKPAEVAEPEKAEETDEVKTGESTDDASDEETSNETPEFLTPNQIEEKYKVSNTKGLRQLTLNTLR